MSKVRGRAWDCNFLNYSAKHHPARVASLAGGFMGSQRWSGGSDREARDTSNRWQRDTVRDGRSSVHPASQLSSCWGVTRNFGTQGKWHQSHSLCSEAWCKFPWKSRRIYSPLKGKRKILLFKKGENLPLNLSGQYIMAPRGKAPLAPSLFQTCQLHILF